MTDSDILISQSPVMPNGQLPMDGVPITNRLTITELAAFVECILLVASESPSITELAITADVDVGHIEAAIAELQMQTDRGWVIQRHGDHVQLGTAPRFADHVRRFLGLDREAKLSSAALEALAIVAYQQPTTRAELESIRGVDCSGVLATLHARGLIENTGRRSAMGNPNEYGTTSQFLQHFGLASLSDLPELGRVDGQDVTIRLEQMSAEAPQDSAVAGSAQ
ncbi:MAG: SMC-Scp complex subunit ScpB [Thermomicrobiales bacterium]